jgi:hypothetical protein
MSIMSELFTHMEELVKNARSYFKTRVEVVKLNAAAKVSLVTSRLIAAIIVGVVFVFVLLFGGMAAGYGLGEWLGKTYLGFLIVTGFYLLVGIIVLAARERLIRIPIMNSIIQQLFKENDHEKDKEY